MCLPGSLWILSCRILSRSQRPVPQRTTGNGIVLLVVSNCLRTTHRRGSCTPCLCRRYTAEYWDCLTSSTAHTAPACFGISSCISHSQSHWKNTSVIELQKKIWPECLPRVVAVEKSQSTQWRLPKDFDEKIRHFILKFRKIHKNYKIQQNKDNKLLIFSQNIHV